ncbi:MAG TPA: carboxypeptidase regulatory-like domain-containing protein [Bacteroidota bacterium]|nr:carboxypeptidase regulatory-like domain-containing protein [Bacteroidota bacterium]
MKKLSFFALSLLCLAAFMNDSSAGTLTGKVHFKGAKPAPVKIKMTADKKCERVHAGMDVYSDQVVVNPNGTLKNVFVYVKSGLAKKKYPAPKEKAKFDQSGCQYTPHVFGVMVDQKIEISNSDETLHNVHALPKNSKQFNIAQPKKGMKRVESFSSPEVMVKIKCEVHNWMAAYVGVMDNPFFAVSDDQGKFSIKDLPAGEYEIEAWHEKYGTSTMKVSVGAADTKTADFSYQGK